ncbi:DUF5047 domain-containing protein [Promicromonospora vindobonensis]|uniref:DUF5047 domain-containing protein n=1 Tax=Promicromonospora vindobonensis TaxID=195748 RepID=A0ABW5VN06_9MICO
MWSVPDGYGDVVRASNGLVVLVDVLKGGQVLHAGLPVVGGAITVNAQAATRRSISLTVPPFIPTGRYTQVPALPERSTDILGHYGQELRVTHALVAPDGPQLRVPVGRFRIDDADGSDLGRTAVTVTGVSREAYVVDDQFTSPRTVSGPSATAIIRSLITETLPQASVSVQASRDGRVLPRTEDSDRWGLIESLASSIGAVVYADPTGRFVIADAPTVSTPPVWTFAAAAGHSLLDARRTSSRANVYNRVRVIGATVGNTTYSAMATDTAASSPTRYGDPDAGLYGKSVTVLSFPELEDFGSCRTVADAELGKRTGAASALDLSAIPHAGLEALDVVDVQTVNPTSGAAVVRRHIVDSFTLPLTPAGAFPVRTRQLREVTS